MTGSAMLRSLRDQWCKTDKKMEPVRIVHPLCLLRHSELYDPDGAAGVVKNLREQLDDEYALKLIMSNGSKTNAVDKIDADIFCSSLASVLAGVVARSAEQNDRSLSELSRLLKGDSKFDHVKYVSVVREGIASFFYDAFVSVNDLVPDFHPPLPVASLPSLSLPLKKLRGHSAADRFFVELHDASRDWHAQRSTLGSILSRIRPSTSPFGKSLETLRKVRTEDIAGYSAMLCAAVAYIAKGRNWLGAAETMASTAAMLALGREGESLPQGNEALYLKAFLMRMRFKATGEHVIEWLEQHDRLMDAAERAFVVWKVEEPELAEERISAGSNDADLTRGSLVALRYRTERVAGVLFACLPDLCVNHHPGDSSFDQKQVLELVNSILPVFADCMEISEIKPTDIHRPAYEFVISQVWVTVLQTWLLVDTKICNLPEGADGNSNLEIRELVNLLGVHISENIYKYMKVKPESKFIKILATVFAMKHDNKSREIFGVVEQDFKDVSFASIDEHRIPFLIQLWNA